MGRTERINKIKDHFHGLQDCVLNINPINTCEEVNKQTLLDLLQVVKQCIYNFREEIEE